MKKKILVVDDHPVILKLTTNLLEKEEGHEVLTASNGLDALEIALTHKPDIILVDLLIPKIAGDKLCQIIRSTPELKNMYIILLTAMAAEMELDFATLGANACIAKGVFKNTKKHILAALEQASKTGTSKDIPTNILGIEEIYSRQVTKELIHAKNHNEIMLNNISNGILEITPKAQIIYTNSQAASFFKKSEEQLLGTFFHNHFSKINSRRIKKLLEEASGKPQTIGEEKPLLINGKSFSLSLIPFNDEKEHSFVVVFKDITERLRHEEKQAELINQLQEALSEIKTLRGLIPICMHCKRIRNDSRGYWEQLENYLIENSEGQFTHGVCPECRDKYYPDIATPNCWEFKLCGQEKTKKCPVVKNDTGHECWLTAGTTCDGQIQGTFAQKLDSCRECDFYKFINFPVETTKHAQDEVLQSNKKLKCKCSE